MRVVAGDAILCSLKRKKASGSKLETADIKSWKSIVVTRMLEEKMRTMEQDMEKKVNIV